MPVPIFEFRCPQCGRKYRTLVGMTSEPDDTKCPQCGFSETSKLVSRPGKFRTEDARLDEIADRLENISDHESASEMRGVVRELGKAMDEDVSDELEDLFDADMSGELDDEG